VRKEKQEEVSEKKVGKQWTTLKGRKKLQK
jgi:hypothetical protein